MSFGQVVWAGITAGAVALLSGCASERADLSGVSSALQKHSGHGLANRETRPGDVDLPGGVLLEDGLSEEEAVTLALWNNAAFQETLVDLGLSHADLAQAGMLPNPTLSMLFPVGAKPLELSVKYPLEVLWLRPSRVATAKLDYERTAQRIVQSALDLIRDVRLAYADLLWANERLQQAQATLSLGRNIAELAQARLRSGETSELEASSARLDVLQAEELVTRSQQEANLGRARLRFLLGLGMESGPLALEETPLSFPLAGDIDRFLRQALAERPDLRAADLGLEAAGKRLGLTRKEWLTFAAVFNAKEVGEDLLSGPGLDVPIPLLNQNQGGIAQARAKFEKAARQYFVVRDRIVLEVREAHARLVQAQDSYAQWHERILPPLEEAVQQSEKAYAAGAVSYLFVLETNRKLFDARGKAAAAAADLRRAYAELERTTAQRLTHDQAQAVQSREGLP